MLAFSFNSTEGMNAVTVCFSADVSLLTAIKLTDLAVVVL